jgi:hypothetical protein
LGIVEDAVGLRCFTPNSDTPYAGFNLDVSDGPMVLELPPGALMGAVNDLHQRWVLDMGLPGPDRGQGGKHVVLPPSSVKSRTQGRAVKAKGRRQTPSMTAEPLRKTGARPALVEALRRRLVPPSVALPG